ncbi:MAG: hypothetical protein GY828_00315 [Candidatus Gracilibacteria bacterium]|nr:hypothetical protein [Candidatus Gracilibacteria bacterium]
MKEVEGKEYLIDGGNIKKSEASVDLSEEIFNQVHKNFTSTMEKEKYSYDQYIKGLSVEKLVDLFLKPSDTYGRHEQYSIQKHREMLSQVLIERFEAMSEKGTMFNEREKQVYESIISDREEVSDKGESEEMQRIIKLYRKGSMRIGQSKSFFENHLEKLDLTILLELFYSRHDLEPGQDKNSVNCRAREIEREVINRIESKEIDLDEDLNYSIGVQELRKIYLEFKGNA